MRNKHLLSRLFAHLNLRYHCFKNDPAARLASAILELKPGSLAIYAGGLLCSRILSYIDNIDPNARPDAIFDRRAENESLTVNGIHVFAPERLSARDYDAIVVASEKFIGEIILSMENYIKPDDYQIITLLNCAMSNPTSKWSEI